MFFEPPPAGDEKRAWTVPEPQPWDPPPLETGVVVAIDKEVARSPNVVVRLPTIRAYQHGCMLDIELVMRQGDLSADDFWDLRLSSHSGGGLPGSRRTDPLPRKLMRLGVRYPDGSKVTTIDSAEHSAQPRGEPPTRPRLSWWPHGSGGRGLDIGYSSFALWLWPLPTAETFEIAVEWPLGGVDLTFTELDGAPIVAAAARSIPYWPDAQPD